MAERGAARSAPSSAACRCHRSRAPVVSACEDELDKLDVRVAVGVGRWLVRPQPLVGWLTCK